MRYCIWLAVVLFMLSCGNAGDGRKYQFALKLSPGQKFYFDLSNEMRSKIAVDDKKVENRSLANIGLIYEVLKDSAGSYSVRIVYDKIRVKLKDNKGEQQLDADNAVSSFDPVEKMLGNLKGASLVVTLDKKGNIRDIAGSREIAEKVMSGVRGQGMYMEQSMEQLMSQFAGDIFVRNNLAQSFRLFPDSGIHIGDSWNQQYTQTADINFEADAKYTFTRIKNGLAEIEMASTIANAKNQQTSVMGQQVASDIKGKHNGIIRIDTATGLLLNQSTSTAMEGTVQVMGRQMPIELNLKRQMNGRKLN
jgi:hypothetical protein